MIIRYIKTNSESGSPYQAYPGDYGFDLTATSKEYVSENVIRYGLGIATEIDIKSLPWYIRLLYKMGVIKLCIDLRPRSSIYKSGLLLSNSPSTIDIGYRGEIFAVFYKVAPGKEYEVGDRICQAMVGVTLNCRWLNVQTLSSSQRGAKGYGSSGK